jgi:CheY-like chemotaxis protein
MKTILQVEDDSNDVFFFQRAMKKAGVANPIQVVSDGREAIDYLKGAGKFADRAQFPLPSLVLLDLKLPYVMGMEVLRWIRQQPGTPMVVVMLTASSEDVDIAAAYRLGANAFLVKPVDSSKLEDMVRAIGDFWLTHNALPEPSCRQRAPAHSSMIDPGARPLSDTIGARPQEPHPVISEPTYQTNRSVGL